MPWGSADCVLCAAPSPTQHRCRWPCDDNTTRVIGPQTHVCYLWDTGETTQQGVNPIPRSVAGAAAGLRYLSQVRQRGAVEVAIEGDLVIRRPEP